MLNTCGTLLWASVCVCECVWLGHLPCVTKQWETSKWIVLLFMWLDASQIHGQIDWARVSKKHKHSRIPPTLAKQIYSEPVQQCIIYLISKPVHHSSIKAACLKKPQYSWGETLNFALINASICSCSGSHWVLRVESSVYFPGASTCKKSHKTTASLCEAPC